MRWVTAKYRSLHARIDTTARRLRGDERGATFVITAIAAIVLVGFCGLAIDVVMWEVAQRQMQGAADQVPQECKWRRPGPSRLAPSGREHLRVTDHV